MKTITSIASVAVLSIVALAAGCAVQPGDGDASSSQAAVSATSKLVGTWNSKGADGLLYYSFSFVSDHSFSAMGGCQPNANGPSCFEETTAQGTWKLEKSGPQLGDPAGAAEIVLDDQFGQETTYFYSLSGKTLSLSTVYDGTVSKFEKGAAPTPPAPSACEVAGGSCVALSPTSCANGTVTDANTYSCGTGLGVECCMPGSGNDAGTDQADAASDASACQVDSDCGGLLPESCTVCSDGSSGCAHWSCQAGQCVTSYCD